jgi:sialic acid synthase SpsE
MIKGEIDIDGKKIGENNPVYFIAEAGVNHEGNKNLARALTEVAVWAGVDALKVQTFKSDLIVTQKAEKAEYQQSNLQNQDSQYDMLKKLELDEAGHEFIKEICEENSISFLSCPHSSFWSVDYLDSLGVPAFKVGSGDLTNLPILKYIAKKGKPVILATGMGNLEEVVEAVESIKEEGNDKIIVLHCTTNYPCPIEEVNLKAMQTIKEKCGVLVGYSDHTNGIEVPIMATAMGATVIEKHYTIDPKMKGNSPDHTSSLSPSEIKDVVDAIKFTKQSGITDPIEAVKRYIEHKKIKEEDRMYSDSELESALGDGIKEPTESELKIMEGVRKSITAIKNIKKGEKFTPENVDIKRPLGGLHPREYNRLISESIALKDISLDEAITNENSR